MTSQEKNILQEPQADYEKAEMDLLRDALMRSPSEHFDVLSRLIKIGIMLKNAKIISAPKKACDNTSTV
jgi:hypothetical protein